MTAAIFVRSNQRMISNRRFSLWLMPEEPHFTKLKTQQDRIIATYPSLPPFDPHVTLIGGVEICKCCKIEDIKKTTGTSTMEDIDKEAAKIVLNRLQTAFKGLRPDAKLYGCNADCR